jgi:hypothetical protein
MEDYDGSREVYLRKVVGDEEYVGDSFMTVLGSSRLSPTCFFHATLPHVGALPHDCATNSQPLLIKLRTVYISNPRV